MAILLTLLLMIPTAALAEQQSGKPRIVKFAGGETIVDSKGGTDHVTVKDVHGQLVSEAWCESGMFDHYFALFTKLKAALARQDRRATAKLLAYPFRVNGKKPQTFRDQAALLKAFDKVFTPSVLAKVRAAEPAAVFCRNGEGMLGDGVIWAWDRGAIVLNP